jgi:hypothetical protein
VPAVGFIDRIDGQHANAVDAERVKGGSRSDHFVDSGFGVVDRKSFEADLFRSIA